MSDTPDAAETVNLKDPVLAGVLAWLFPGLGHFYQGRRAKGGLLLVCIMGTFLYGAYLGSGRELGLARVVYFSFRPADRRWAYLCQVGVGLPALPALVQAIRTSHGRAPLLGGVMAPPTLPGGDPRQPTPHKLNYKLNHFFELGTVYTMAAGLLNILAIYDAAAGPVFTRREDEEEQSEEKPSEGRADG